MRGILFEGRIGLVIPITLAKTASRDRLEQRLSERGWQKFIVPLGRRLIQLDAPVMVIAKSA